MGCAGSYILSTGKNSANHEEKVICGLERNLPFSQKACRELVNTFRLNSSNGFLNSLQLARAFNDLAWTESRKNYSGMNKILNALNKDSKIPMMSLCILSLLLGKANQKTKAEILFALMDPEANGSISPVQLQTMLTNLLVVSAEILPQVTLENEILTKEEVNGYVKRLKRKSQNFVKKIAGDLLKGSELLSQEEFLKNLASEKLLEKLTCSEEIRLILLGESIEDDLDASYTQSIVINASFPEEKMGIFDMPNEEIDSPVFDFTSSDEEDREVKKKTEVIKKAIGKNVSLNAKRPPRPIRSHETSEVTSPDNSFISQNLSSPKSSEKELWRNGGEKKTLTKVRCSSLTGRKNDSVVLKYRINDKNVEIELKQWEDPIRIAHTFSVKNKLGKKERNNIAVLLMKLQKSS